MQYQPLPHSARETLDWLLQMEEFTAARPLIEVLARLLPPDNPEASDFIASAWMRSKHYANAVRQARHTLKLLPTATGAKFNLAKCLNSAALPAEAEYYMRQVVEESPGWVDPKIDLAVYIAAQGRNDEAMQMLLSILENIDPHDANIDVVRFNLGWHFLRLGQFKKGIRYLGLGRRLRIWGAFGRQYMKPSIDEHTDVSGKTVMVVGEGGAGDEIINARFAANIEARGGRVVWITGQGFEGVLRRTPGISAVLPQAEMAGVKYDYWAPAMDLPRLLDLDYPDLGRPAYIAADPAVVARWQQHIPHRPGRLRVGLRWQGNQLYEQDLMRSVPFAQLADLTAVDGIDFYSLQRDAGAEERPHDSPVVDLAPLLRTWDDTAAAIHHLDLVISSCTSVPHLAAAMGKPTWVLCPINAYYVWAMPGTSSPWYPQVTLFRQVRNKCWDEPLSELKTHLARWAHEGAGDLQHKVDSKASGMHATRDTSLSG